MAVLSVTDLLAALQRYPLLTEEQMAPLAHLACPDARSLAKELIQRGWLTPYQVNQLFQDRAQEMLLGHYVLMERLGEGGMGLVFKARHRRLDRVVALKLIRKDCLTNEETVRRFRREIQAVAKLAHPHIVLAFDADEADGMHYYAMEYVEGTDLGRQVVAHGPLPVAEACDYIRQAALALQHAHEKELVHRDIKPSNLLLTARNGTVKLLDLGLARLRPPVEDSSASSLTAVGSIVGTPDYMAPEQATSSHDVDIRADLYSLGCTLYFLLAGQAPFAGLAPLEKLFHHRYHAAVPVESLRREIGRPWRPSCASCWPRSRKSATRRRPSW
jgi:serine/threonine protein kinase